MAFGPSGEKTMKIYNENEIMMGLALALLLILNISNNLLTKGKQDWSGSMVAILIALSYQ